MKKDRGHFYMTCDGGDDCACGGNICRGGLAVCEVCLGAEGSLPFECPGRKLTAHEHEDVYAGRLDYCMDQWWDLTDPKAKQDFKTARFAQKGGAPVGQPEIGPALVEKKTFTYRCICGASQTVEVPPGDTATWLQSLPPGPVGMNSIAFWRDDAKSGIRRSVAFWYCVHDPKGGCSALWQKHYPDPYVLFTVDPFSDEEIAKRQKP